MKISSIITLLKLQKLKISSIIIILINILLLQKAADVFHARLVRANLVKKKTDFDALLSSFNMRVFANTREILLAKDQLNKLKTFDSSYSIGKSHFNENGT